jgi:CheY-like chemotaxis protein
MGAKLRKFANLRCEQALFPRTCRSSQSADRTMTKARQCCGAKVLVVEDEALIGEMIGEALSDSGFEVCVAADASEALEHLAEGFTPDVLFTDINLPGDMDGSLLAFAARKLCPDLPVVYASAAWDALNNIRTVPGSLFVSKPYSPRTICSLMTRLTSAPAAA